jgi:hypothetical protein
MTLERNKKHEDTNLGISAGDMAATISGEAVSSAESRPRPLNRRAVMKTILAIAVFFYLTVPVGNRAPNLFDDHWLPQGVKFSYPVYRVLGDEIPVKVKI